MKSIIIYDSIFGNTEQIALAIRDSMDPKENVEAFRIKDIKPQHLIGLKLLIVGSPTRAFKPTKAIVDFLNQIIRVV
ncbi:MAG: hypothetical protein M0T74_15615 [Desulfitobacterium hafniense]|nr:hypothetical protein [Desulfitobacterium hafniense]